MRQRWLMKSKRKTRERDSRAGSLSTVGSIQWRLVPKLDKTEDFLPEIFTFSFSFSGQSSCQTGAFLWDKFGVIADHLVSHNKAIKTTDKGQRETWQGQMWPVNGTDKLLCQKAEVVKNIQKIFLERQTGCWSIMTEKCEYQLLRRNENADKNSTLLTQQTCFNLQTQPVPSQGENLVI